MTNGKGGEIEAIVLLFSHRSHAFLSPYYVDKFCWQYIPFCRLYAYYVLYTLCFPFLLQVLTAQDLVDFSPVYRCLHIYSVLVCIKVTSKRDLNFWSYIFIFTLFILLIVPKQAGVLLLVLVVLDEPAEMGMGTQGMSLWVLLCAS